jgi:hypothetical protein
VNGNPYLMDVFAAYQPGAASTTVLPPAAGAPAPNASGFPSLGEMAPQPVPTGPPPAPIGPPVAPPPGPNEDPTKQMSVAPPPGPSQSAAPPQPAGPPAAPNVNAAPQDDFPLQRVGGGGVLPAHEVDLRGPTLKAAQDATAAATQGAIESTTGRTEAMAQREYDMAYEQEQMARARQVAIERSAAEREQELQSLQTDFHASVQALSQAAVDPNRFWATRSTGQRTMAMASLILGGFASGGGPNMGLEIINQAIDRDINAQMQSYQLKRDVVAGKQTAFAMAMQKYQNADAARAMARAAALDVVQAQAAQMGALWKGTEAANRSDQLMAQLQADKMNQIAQGVRFVQAQATGPVFMDRHGITYDMNQARQVATTFRADEQKREEIGLNKAGDVIVAGAKASAEQQAKQQAHRVVLPTGEVFSAPSEKDAGEVRDLVTSTQEVRRLIAEAKAIRENAAVAGVPLSPSERGKLASIQSDLITNFAVQHKLGALSESDRDLALQGTSDLFALGPKADAQLERLNQSSTAKLHSRLKTYEGAPAKATGKMPGSFAQHGGGK